MGTLRLVQPVLSHLVPVAIKFHSDSWREEGEGGGGRRRGEMGREKGEEEGGRSERWRKMKLITQ